MAFPKPPLGFTTLDRVVNSDIKSYNTIGVCVGYLEPTKSKGTDYTSKVILHDPGWFTGRGLEFRFFNGFLCNIPTIQGHGDVVILRNVTTKVFNHKLIGLSTSTTSWVVLSGSSVAESTCEDGSDIVFATSGKADNEGPGPTIEELKYAKEIVRLEDPAGYKPPPKPTNLEILNRIRDAGGTPIQRKDKYKPIKDLNLDATTRSHYFADLFGEIRKTWYSDYGRMTLHLTDYTTNKLLYKYSEESSAPVGDTYSFTGGSHEKWPGPWGRMTIEVLLYDAHAQFAKSQVKAGMFVYIRNCQIKFDPNGSRLEAVCRGDREDPSKVNLKIFPPHKADTDPRFLELLTRRLEYEKYAKAKDLRFVLGKLGQQDSKKRPIDTVEATEKPNQEASTGNAKKHESKSARRRQKRAAKQNADLSTTITNANTETNQLTANQYVRCENHNVPTKFISDILDPSILSRKTAKGNPFALPFQNCAYKAKVRVVDYWPANLEDFSVPYLVSDSIQTSSSPATQTLSGAPIQISTPTHAFFKSDSMSQVEKALQTNPHSVRWEWRFILIVEDAHSHSTTPARSSSSSSSSPHQMALLVADQDAEYLLNSEATDLHANPIDLAKLREKMFVLWGDLQEYKEEAFQKRKNRLQDGKSQNLGADEMDVDDDVDVDVDVGAGVGAGAGARVKAHSKPFHCFIKEYGVPLPGRAGDDEGSAMGEGYQRMFRMFGTSI